MLAQSDTHNQLSARLLYGITPKLGNVRIFFEFKNVFLYHLPVMLLVCLKHLALYLFGIYKLCCDSMKSSEERPRPETSVHYPALVIFSAIIAGGLLYGLLSKTPEEAGLEATGQDWDIGLVDTVNMVLDDGSVYEGTVIAGSSTREFGSFIKK